MKPMTIDSAVVQDVVNGPLASLRFVAHGKTYSGTISLQADGQPEKEALPDMLRKLADAIEKDEQ